MKNGKILIVDDNEDVLIAAKLLLKQHYNSIVTISNPELIPQTLQENDFDVILLDMNFRKDMTSGAEGYFWLKKIIEIDAEAVVILITAYGDVDTAVQAIKEGATDFILKPWQNQKLLATVSSALNLRESRDEAKHLRYAADQLSKDMDRSFHNIVGKCDLMQEVYNTIDKVANTEANVLILGENGTGKELVARALHRKSNRNSEVFITVDMGAIPETLFESELFGHERGAFTDAKVSRPGRFEIAGGGTLFLDEISSLPLTLQAKLLRVLESRQVNRLGSVKPMDINIRLVCASNVEIYKAVDAKEFRQDLLYRINTVEINLPPLRVREDDIGLLTEHFIRIYANKYRKKTVSVSSAAMTKLEKYHWPGNIRELQHAIERAVILSESKVLKPSDFLFPESSVDEDIEATLNIEDTERNLIKKALRKHSGNISQAANELGLTRTSLYRRMEKYGF